MTAFQRYELKLTPGCMARQIKSHQKGIRTRHDTDLKNTAPQRLVIVGGTFYDTAMLKVEAYRHPRTARESGLVGVTSDPCHLLRSGGGWGFPAVA